MAGITFDMISKEPRIFETVDKDGNKKQETRQVPVNTTTFQLQADEEALKGFGALMAPPSESILGPINGDHLIGAGVATAVIAVAGHGLVGETVQGWIHTLVGAK